MTTSIPSIVGFNQVLLLKNLKLVKWSFVQFVEVRAIMAPRVNKNAKIIVKKKHPAEQAIAEIKKHVEENSNYVGKDFAKEARAMHLGDLPERPIYGEAKAEEAKSLIDDGIPVTPLPFTPNRKTN